MFSKPHCPVIAIEEHYWDEELAKTYVGGEAGRPGEQQKRLYDFGPLRIKEMDDVGIDMQVISLGAPSTQKLPAETAAALTRRVNDRLHAQVGKNPQRFAAFAGLPTAVPEAAAEERTEAAVRYEADLGERQQQVCARSHDDQIAAERIGSTDAGCEACNDGQNGFRHRGDRSQADTVFVLQLPRDCGPGSWNLLQIGTGAETAARTGENNRANLRVVLGLPQRLVQSGAQRRCERVQRRGPVERDQSDPPPLLVQNLRHMSLQ